MSTYILCKNKAERDAVLKAMDRKGIRWVGGGEMPSTWESVDWEDDDSVYLIAHTDNSLSWSFSYGDIGDVTLSARDYLAKNNKCYPILIYRKGRTVTAEDRATGDKGVAVCSPDDEFNFYTGAMIALCRLVKDNISNDAKTEMRKLLGDLDTDDFKVGDVVKVVNDGACYSMYDTWVKDNVTNINDCIHYCYKKNIPAEKCHRYTVKAIGPHDVDSKKTLYYIKNIATEECFLMEKRGIEKV